MTKIVPDFRKSFVRRAGNTIWVHAEGRTYFFQISENSANKGRVKVTGNESHDGILRSPMPGKVLKINVKVGDLVLKGQTVCVLEAMKMEYALKAPFEGKIISISKEEAALVELDAQIMVVKK